MISKKLKIYFFLKTKKKIFWEENNYKKDEYNKLNAYFRKRFLKKFRMFILKQFKILQKNFVTESY